MSVDLEAALQALGYGFCLWIGAGVTTHLGHAGGVDIPTWLDLTTRMESASGVAASTEDCPGRLQRCLDKVGREFFHSTLCRELIDPFKLSMLEARRLTDSSRYYPIEFQQIAALGLMANPIVNFNVERYTSFAVGSCGGPFELKCYQPSATGKLSFYTAGGSYNPFRFQRTVYHPHGALDTGRGCVFAKSDYESLQGTLALELAIHAAFGSRLIIVGMSLDDVYLREQIVKYRQYLGHILWFTSSLPPATMCWAQASEVDFVEIEDWELFWKAVQSTALFLDKRQVDKAWYIVTELAAGNDDVER